MIFPLFSDWPMMLPNSGGLERIQLPNLNKATVTGIAVSIVGNMLISLALNCQKLAHRRLEIERETRKDAEATAAARPDSNGAVIVVSSAEDDVFASSEQGPQHPTTTGNVDIEREPLLRSSANGSSSYGSAPPHNRSTSAPPKAGFFSRFWRRKAVDLAKEGDSNHMGATHALLPVDVVAVHSPSSEEGGLDEDDGSESDYLRSKLWWLGFILMNIGEMGNFISYAFAPASVVAPLGTFALVANCVFAPLMLGERFRKRDFFGIFVAILGAVTVVLSTNPSDVRLGPKELLHAISSKVFIAYTIIYVVGAVILTQLSERPIGKRWVFVDVGICALYGGFTVLSTKAFSTLLTMEWFEIFTEWITYPVLAILLGTGVGQIRYLNRALMKFDSKIVVPTQFVFFNLSAIVGSAILYGDFKKASFHQIVTFLYGCGATFAGVFLISWAPTIVTTGDMEEDQDDLDPILEDEPIANPDPNMRLGSLSRRNRATLIIPDGIQSSPGSPVIGPRQNLVSMMSFSPAQRVLLMNTPPRDGFIRPLSQDVERDLAPSPSRTPDMTRRRAISWFGDEGPNRSSLRRVGTRSHINLNGRKSRDPSQTPGRDTGPS